jgi:hypothetical protein
MGWRVRVLELRIRADLSGKKVGMGKGEGGEFENGKKSSSNFELIPPIVNKCL